MSQSIRATRLALEGLAFLPMVILVFAFARQSVVAKDIVFAMTMAMAPAIALRTRRPSGRSLAAALYGIFAAFLAFRILISEERSTYDRAIVASLCYCFFMCFLL